jgi:PST family polysaccharide transporter
VSQPPAASAARLDRSLVHGIAWTAALKWVSQVLSWASTIIIARLLTPSDYGLVGMATVYIGLVQLVNEFGLGAAIVQQRDLTRDQLARLGGLSLLLGVVLTLLSLAMAGVIARFFGEPAVRWVVMALSVTFFTTAFQVLPRALLNRDLRFPRLALLDGTEAVAITIGTLACAVLGLGYWALVLGNIGGRLVATGLAVSWRPHPLAWPRDLRSLTREITFGGHVVVSRVAWYAYNNADAAVVGRLLGSAALGAYSIGWTIASIPVDRVSAMVMRVTPGVFSAVQHDLAALRRYVLGISEGLALVTFPASVGLALVADDFVAVVLGQKWIAAVMPLRLLALYGGFRSLTTLLPQVLFTVGQSRRSMQFNLLAAVVLPLAFIVGSRWGPAGVAAGWVVAYPLVVIPFFYRAAFRALELPTRDYFRALWPATSATLAMTAVVLAAEVALAGRLAPVPELAVLVLGGAATYGATLWWRHRRRLEAFRALWQRMRTRTA